MDNKDTSVLTNFGVKIPIFVVLSLIDQLVLRLWRSEFVEVELVKVVRLLQLLGRGRGVVAAVKKPAPVVLPRGRGKFYPLYVIGEIFARLDVAHFPFLPIRAGGR